ncbi:hypothetical protein C8263_07860 [Deinococcus arcticus]|uniref:Uncharacterized protein n=1 Tax=Deinococcus arcticus TaxID=2136176 RepID=A0A2T3W8X8_9DEIO|nr:hypothetical protein C8263_07860 [Deinococcus arcticus]
MGSELRLDVLTGGQVRLSFGGREERFGTVEDAFDGAALWPGPPGDLYDALAWELDLLAGRDPGRWTREDR